MNKFQITDWIFFSSFVRLPLFGPNMFELNPFLATSEYEVVDVEEETTKNGHVSKQTLSLAEKKNVKNFPVVANPFLEIPEYDVELDDARINKNEPSSQPAKQKIPNSRVELKKLTAMAPDTSECVPQEEKNTIQRGAALNQNGNLNGGGKSSSGGSTKKNKQRLKRKLHRMQWGLSKTSTEPTEENNEQLSCFEDVGGFELNATAKDLARVVANHPEHQSESEDSEEDVPVKRKKLTKAEKRAKALEEERKLKLKERELLRAEENPNSPDHFERLLLGSPDSAELWIKYMGYHAVNADIEKARAVGRRAIKRIDPVQTAAKLDVWKALLNLEHTFCPIEQFKETFAEALKCNDDYAINTQVLKLYTDSKNVTEVDQLTNVMVKKYKDNVECWLQCQNALMDVGLGEKARNLLQKALAVMTKKDHITLISRFALLENKHGFHEQAQALFENLMTSFPQRLDLLSVYVDMLVKSQHADMARNVLARAAGNTLPARKMKSIYMKWLAFEEAHGSPSDVSKVESAAKKYVANVLTPRGQGPLNNKCEKSAGIKKEVDSVEDIEQEELEDSLNEELNVDDDDFESE